MELLVIRHGIATERKEGADEASDADRPLTGRGRRRFRRVVGGLARLGVLIDRVRTSPKRRAVETAALLEPIVADDAAVAVSPYLTGPPRGELFAELAELGGLRIALVGHEPYLGQLIALLTVGSVEHGEALALKKGGVAWLEGTPAPGCMRVLAVMSPRVLRRIR